MKELENLRRRIHWSECVHLALMTLALAFSLILTFQSDDRLTQLLFALGTVIPVQLIRLICERIGKKLPRLLLSLGVTGLSILVTWAGERWSCYLICCIPILISGVFLPRSKGRILLTVPSPYAAIPMAFAYAYGRAVESLGVPWIASLILILTALMTVNYFVYFSQTKLLRDLSYSGDTETSVSGMIRQNRKTVVAFLLIGALILTAVPFLLSTKPPEVVPRETGEAETSTVFQHEKPHNVIDASIDREGAAPLHLELYRDILLGILILVPSVGAIISVIAGIRILLSRVQEKRKRAEPKLADGLTVERLEALDHKKERERLTGYEKKLRRRYEKLIRSRTPEKASLAALTPTELERAADLRGEGAETVHTLYSQTRYSEISADRERYAAFKEAVKNLAPPREKT